MTAVLFVQNLSNILELPSASTNLAPVLYTNPLIYAKMSACAQRDTKNNHYFLHYLMQCHCLNIKATKLSVVNWLDPFFFTQSGWVHHYTPTDNIVQGKKQTKEINPIDQL